jgi:hypothetical protein
LPIARYDFQSRSKLGDLLPIILAGIPDAMSWPDILPDYRASANHCSVTNCNPTQNADTCTDANVGSDPNRRCNAWLLINSTF